MLPLAGKLDQYILIAKANAFGNVYPSSLTTRYGCYDEVLFYGLVSEMDLSLSWEIFRTNVSTLSNDVCNGEARVSFCLIIYITILTECSSLHNSKCGHFQHFNVICSIIFPKKCEMS